LQERGHITEKANYNFSAKIDVEQDFGKKAWDEILEIMWINFLFLYRLVKSYFMKLKALFILDCPWYDENDEFILFLKNVPFIGQKTRNKKNADHLFGSKFKQSVLGEFEEQDIFSDLCKRLKEFLEIDEETEDII
jgi:hypothetical protein